VARAVGDAATQANKHRPRTARPVRDRGRTRSASGSSSVAGEVWRPVFAGVRAVASTEVLHEAAGCPRLRMRQWRRWCGSCADSSCPTNSHQHGSGLRGRPRRGRGGFPTSERTRSSARAGTTPPAAHPRPGRSHKEPRHPDSHEGRTGRPPDPNHNHGATDTTNPTTTQNTTPRTPGEHAETRWIAVPPWTAIHRAIQDIEVFHPGLRRNRQAGSTAVADAILAAVLDRPGA
jgi:hypothetical protein